MLYVKVVIGLPIEGHFDYIVPENLRLKISSGSRVVVPFGRQKKTGFVIGFSSKSSIKKLKPILQLLDERPVLSRNMLLLAKKVSDYYCCSWGEAIRLSLPVSLRGVRTVQLKDYIRNTQVPADKPKATLVHCSNAAMRWNEVYLDKIKTALSFGKSIIILQPDIPAVLEAEKILRANFDSSCIAITVLYRNQPDELKKWIDIKEGRVNIAVGTRSGIFAPFNNLGLIILDEEQFYGYKQDQTPHYNAREVCFFRADIENAEFLMGGATVSLETMYLVKKKKIEYKLILETKSCLEVKINDMKGLPLVSSKKNLILSKYLEDSIMQILNSKGRVLLFLDRLGFATIVSCPACGFILKCERCNTNLVFHYKENILRCRYCNFRLPPPKICPKCNSNYIRYSGAGTEKIESELARLFPQARVESLDKRDDLGALDSGIFISTQAIIRTSGLKFDLTAALSVDNSLNYPDFRATEKLFHVLTGMINLTDKKAVIQTSIPKHYIFKALAEGNGELFYESELKQRRDVDLPPYKHFCLIKLRGKPESKVESAAKTFFDKLSKESGSGLKFISVNPGTPLKLRGNFYWQILMKSASPFKISNFLKKHLKTLPHSGIIVTVDMDPI